MLSISIPWPQNIKPNVGALNLGSCVTTQAACPPVLPLPLLHML